MVVEGTHNDDERLRYREKKNLITQQRGKKKNLARPLQAHKHESRPFDEGTITTRVGSVWTSRAIPVINSSNFSSKVCPCPISPRLSFS